MDWRSRRVIPYPHIDEIGLPALSMEAQNFPYKDLTTSQGDALQVIHVGFDNQYHGP